MPTLSAQRITTGGVSPHEETQDHRAGRVRRGRRPRPGRLWRRQQQRRQRQLVERRAGFNAAVTKVVNPSDHKGGTLTFGCSSTPDSTDPGNTYYAFMWNFTRLYTMPLMTYKSCPGACGLQVVPDLATAPGRGQ